MWARRKPALAGLSAALLVASILGVVGIAWQWREAVYQRDRAEIARDEADRSRRGWPARPRPRPAPPATPPSPARRPSGQREAAVAARAEAEKNAQIAGDAGHARPRHHPGSHHQVRRGLDRPGLFDLKADDHQSALKRVDRVAKIYQGITSKEATTLAALIELGQIYRQTGQVQKAMRSSTSAWTSPRNA